MGTDLSQGFNDHVEASQEHDQVVCHGKGLDIDRFAVAHQALSQVHSQNVCDSSGPISM